MKTDDQKYSLLAKLLHLGLAGFGIAAYLTAEGAEGGFASNGYLLHAYLGLSLAAVMLLRLGAGAAGSRSLTFREWALFSGDQWRMIGADLAGLIRFKIPDRGRHQGLAGLVQALGLLLFAWMAATGTLIYFLGGGEETALFEAVEEAHEIGEGLIPLYLILHVGAVILHSITGAPVWQQMFKFGKRS